MVSTVASIRHNNGSHVYSCLDSQTCEWDFVDVIPLKILRSYPGLSRWAQRNHRILIRESEESVRIGDVKRRLA